jgi:hypothetical protein
MLLFSFWFVRRVCLRAGSSAKAETPTETRHDCAVLFDRPLWPCRKIPRPLLEFAVSSSLYDDAPIRATRGHPTARRLERPETNGALEKLYPLVQPESHRLADHYMSWERAGHTLQTTAIAKRESDSRRG